MKLNASQKIELRDRIAEEAWKNLKPKPPWMRKSHATAMIAKAMERYVDELELKEAEVKSDA